MDVFGFGGGQATGFDGVEDLVYGELGHVVGVVGQLEEIGGDHVDAQVGGLGGEQDCDQEGEGVFVVKRDGWFWVEFVEDEADFIGAFLNLFGDLG